VLDASNALLDMINQRFALERHPAFVAQDGMVTLELSPEALLAVCRTLSRDPAFDFAMLIDLCGVDYLEYGCQAWRTEDTTTSGFSRGVEHPPELERNRVWEKPRFAVVYHLLSLSHNQYVRIRVFLSEEALILPSVTPIWSAANWYEREAFDLFGIVFEGHPDLRRLLTDYGFVGHPFRKDFPLIGEVELRYDALQGRCVYEPVSIQERVLVPRVVRSDNRYASHSKQEEPHG
jgi:NADH-quinone oxidoreductase subunit C